MRGRRVQNIIIGAGRSLLSAISLYSASHGSPILWQRRLGSRRMSNLPTATIYDGPTSPTSLKRVTLRHLHKKYETGQPITMVTAYDYPSAVHVDQAGIDVALVDDSATIVVHGHDITLPITLHDMLRQCRTVARGAQHPLSVGDLQFGSYEQTTQQAVDSATRLLKEGGTDAVKMEGGVGSRITAARAIAEAGIAVMGDVGLTPQSISVLGGFRPQGNNGKTNSVPTSATELSHVAKGGVGRMHMRSPTTTSRAIDIAIVILKNHLQRGTTAGSYTYVKVLQMCLKQQDLLAAKQLHECIIQSGLDKNPYVVNTLMNVYIHCGKLLYARRVFDELENKTIVTWTMMIAGYAKYDHAESAFEIFNQMRQEGWWPDEITYLCILKACTSPSALKWGKEVHMCIRYSGFESDVRVGTALLQMYADCGCITEATKVFEKLTNRNVITWAVMIGGLAQHGCGHEAYRLFLQMRREGFEPNVMTYVNILNASASTGALPWVKEVHGHARKAGLESDLRVGNALVHMYAKSGSIDDARLVFDRMEKRDVVTWTTMIGGLAHHGCAHEALTLFRKMNADLVKPNGTTFVALMSACCHGGLVDEGRRLFSAMRQGHGIEPTVVHYNCMVDLLGRAGHLEEAKLFIRDMPIEPNAVTWTALLGACRTYGNVELGELTAQEVFKLEPSMPSTYVLLSNIYAAAGKWENVCLVRTMMQKRGVRKEPGRSWIEVDNKIHEFVVGDTSHPEVKAIYTELSKLIEQLKAAGYIPDTRLVLHDINEEDKELALCSHSEKLAIAYGLIHIRRAEPIRVRKNLRVCPDCHTAAKFISKVTGREIIARDVNRFHHFKNGMCSCGDYW